MEVQLCARQEQQPSRSTMKEVLLLPSRMRASSTIVDHRRPSSTIVDHRQFLISTKRGKKLAKLFVDLRVRVRRSPRKFQKSVDQKVKGSCAAMRKKKPGYDRRFGFLVVTNLTTTVSGISSTSSTAAMRSPRTWYVTCNNNNDEEDCIRANSTFLDSRLGRVAAPRPTWHISGC